jgi:SSS family solute:Na+ symporter
MNNIYFQYYSLFIFVASVIVLIVVSYATERPVETRITGLTYATVTSTEREATRASWNRWDVVASGVVLLLIAAAYTYFRG